MLEIVQYTQRFILAFDIAKPKQETTNMGMQTSRISETEGFHVDNVEIED